MNKRLLYPIIIIVSSLVIHFAIEPILYHFVLSNKISLTEYRIAYLIINLLVTVALSIILYYRGKYIRGVQTIAGIIFLNVVLDVVRIIAYPDLAIKSNVVSFFSGIFIFSFSLVSIKMATFKKGAGIFFILLGAVYMLRFPLFMDILYYYFKKYQHSANAAESYYLGTLYANYILIVLGLFALYNVLLENKAWSR